MVLEVVRRANKSDGGPRNRSSTTKSATRSRISGAKRSSGVRLRTTAGCVCGGMEDGVKGVGFIFPQTGGVI